MAGAYTRRSVPLHASSLHELARAVQSAQGNTAAQFVQLGISQVQIGSFSFGPLTQTIAFTAPFVDAGYVLLISPAISPTSLTKASTGFTITVASGPGYALDYAAFHL